MKGIIYKTTNLFNGKWYIGKDSNNDPKYLGSGLLLNRAIKKHGIEYFQKEILEETDDLENREIHWIKMANAIKDPMSYNIAAGGKGGNTIAGFTEQQKEKFSKDISNRWTNHSEQKRKEISKKKSEVWANHSEQKRKEISKKISKALKGRKRTEEHNKKLSNALKGNIPWNVGIPRTEEVKEKLRKANIGKKHTEETKRKMGQSQKGRKHTDETKRKIGLAHKGKIVSKETLLNMSNAQKGKKRIYREDGSYYMGDI